MKRLLFAALLSLSGLISFSQQPLLEQALPELTDNYHYERINCVTDSVHNRLYVVMLAKNAMHAIKISLPGFTVEKEVTAAIAYDDEIEDYYGATIANDTLTMLYSSRHKRVNVYTFIFDSNSFLNIPVAAENKKEKILNAFVWQNKLCFLKLIDPKNDADRHLQINTERPDGAFNTIDFHFSRNDKAGPRSKMELGLGRYGFSSSLISNDYQPINIPVVRARYPNILNYAKYHIKQYCVNNKLFITEEYDNATEVFEMDLESKSSKYHLFMKDGIQGGAAWVESSNSFMAKDYFFQVKAGEGKAVVIVRNLNDTTVKSVFECTGQKDDLLSSGSFTSENRETGFPFSVKAKPIDGMQAFLKALKGNAIGITAEEMQQTFKLTIGGLKVIHGYAGGLSGGSPGGATEYLSSDAVFFNACLTYGTLKAVAIDTTADLHYDKIDAVFAAIKEKVNTYGFFSTDTGNYLCYYNQRKNKVCIVKSD